MYTLEACVIIPTLGETPRDESIPEANGGSSTAEERQAQII